MENELEITSANLPSAHLEKALISAFLSAGWQVRYSDQRINWLAPYHLIVEKPSVRYVIELKVARDARRQELQALLADAVLRSRVAANQHDGKPLAVVGAPSLSDRLIGDLREYMETYAPEQAYGFVDARGCLELVGPRLDEVRHVEPLGETIPYKLQKPQEMFSDLNQWLLKVLLAPKIPEDLLGAPRKDIRNAADLAAIAKVSVPTASRFVNQLKTAGFLESRPRRLELVRTQELLQLWRASRQKPPLEMSARFILPSSDPERRLYRAIDAFTSGWYDCSNQVTWGKNTRACLAQFSACAQLGFGFVSGVPATAYVDNIKPETLDALGLRPVEPGESIQVLLQEPRLLASIFRGVTVASGVPTTDVLQCWLDVSHHPARGQEQANLIWDRVLSRL